MIGGLWIRYSIDGVKAFVTCLFACALTVSHVTAANIPAPSASLQVAASLKAAQWQQLEDGLDVIRGISESGVEVTAFRISQDSFAFSVETQTENSGSSARQIGQDQGAVLVSNAGFFAATGNSTLYPIGYLRLAGEVHSKGWTTDGGILSFNPEGLKLTATHQGIPKSPFDAIQSKPMLIEPGQKWAMGSNTGGAKPRTILCLMKNGDVILTAITRFGLTLYEAGWLMRSRDVGGFFSCDSALAFDGGRSTQIWYSGNDKYSHGGISPVHNFFVVRQKED